ncbi:MAG: MFS transporter [Alphaproteobacteria bacterium]|jgi:MFS family permease
MTAASGGSTRWAMLGLVFAVRAGLGFQFQTVASVGDPLASDLGLSYAELGTLIGVFFLPGLVLAMPVGYAGRYVSDKQLVALGLASLALGAGVCATATAFGPMTFGRVLCGVGFVVCTIFMTKMIADWFTGKEIATAMAILVMSWPFGIAMGQVGHTWLAAAMGWQWAFAAAALYSLAGAVLTLAAYRPPAASPGVTPPATSTAAVPSATTGMTRREWKLVILAALVWGCFNAAFIVYLSFASRVLIAGGYGTFEAAAVISLASWVMILSGAACGQLADRTGKSDIILYICLVVAMVSLALLPQTNLAVPVALAFGLVGMAPAGLIMALTSQAVAPERRAFGMGVFFSIFFLFTAPTPTIAGWLYDLSGDPFRPILLGIAMFGLTMVANVGFRMAQRRT